MCACLRTYNLPFIESGGVTQSSSNLNDVNTGELPLPGLLQLRNGICSFITPTSMGIFLDESPGVRSFRGYTQLKRSDMVGLELSG